MRHRRHLQRPVVCHRELAHQRLPTQLVDAQIGRTAAADHKLAIGAVADAAEELAGHALLGGDHVAALAPAAQVASPVDGSLYHRCLSHTLVSPTIGRVPDEDAAVETGRDQLVVVAPPVQRDHLGGVLETLLQPAAQQVPRAHRVVPGARRQLCAARVEAETGDGALVARQRVQQPSRAQRPDVDLERRRGSGSDQVARPSDNEEKGRLRVAGDAGELNGRRSGQRAEVTVANEVVGADSAVGGGGEQRVAATDVAEVVDSGGVVGEGDEAEAGAHRPQLHLPVVTARSHHGAVGRELQRVDAVVVALLLQHVGLRLPLPDEQLPQRGAAEGEPVAGAVDDAGGDVVATNGEGVDAGEAREFVECEEA